MLARLASACIRGLDAEAVNIEVDLSRGLPAWSMVGLPEAAVREARERVRSAIVNAGFEFPLKRITVNLAPADRKKDGSHFDLPVAIGVLLASGQLSPKREDCAPSSLPFMIGELALDGGIHRINGALPLVLFARAQQHKTVIIPAGNADEVAAVTDIEILTAQHLLDVAAYLTGRKQLRRLAASSLTINDESHYPDMADIRGQQQARRALEIAAAGGHHMLMVGPPGVGKSMLAERLPGILPPLTRDQALEVTRIYSVAGDRSRPPMSRQPPLRRPHHSASDAAIIGGGSTPRPGEISRAHLGILFLDEMPEFKRQVLETLRQPLEEGRVCIARAADTIEFPARFQLIAAMNPCPCGYLGHPSKPCRCTSAQVRRYISRISGPLLDRFDLRITMPPVEQEALAAMQPGEPSAEVAKRVIAARNRQYQRLGEGRSNAGMNNREIERFARPDAQGAELLHRAMQRFSLSARSYHRILRVARTIADLEASPNITAAHIAEALQYRGEEQFGA